MSHTTNTMLGLQMPTDPRWISLVELSLQDILSDHAFCEQKAASQFISLIQAHPEKTDLVQALAPIVTEEWGHFRLVYAELQKRGLQLGRQRKDEYVAALNRLGPKPLLAEKLLYGLCLCALIEARSCERFRLLSEGLEEESLRKFYRRFMESEAGHYRTFLSIAERYYPKESVARAWKDWQETEIAVFAEMPVRGDRMH